MARFVPTSSDANNDDVRQHTTNNAHIFSHDKDWPVEPTFKHLKHEMLRNPYAPISEKTWNGILKKCHDKFCSKRKNPRSKLLKHLIALKLYTDFDILQREFRNSFQVIYRRDDKRFKTFYHWRQALKETYAIDAVMYQPGVVLHGVNSVMCIDQFNGTDFHFARSFAGKSGMILAMKQSEPLDIWWTYKLDVDSPIPPQLSLLDIQREQSSKQSLHHHIPQPFPKCSNMSKRYCLLQLIGCGTFGRVWRATDQETGNEVAIKQLSLHDNIDADASSDIEREISLLTELRGCDNIAQLIAASKVFNEQNKQNEMWIVMSLYNGGNLKSLINKNKHGLDETIIAQCLRDVLNGLMHLHDFQIIHRDIKPENILIHGNIDEIENCKFVLTDFGTSKKLIGTIAHTAYRGTFFYMAPEAINFEYETGFTFSADIWSIGLTTFEMAEGALPPKYLEMAKKGPMKFQFYVGNVFNDFQCPRLSQRNKNSKEIHQFVQSALMFDPIKRPSAKELYHDAFVQKHTNIGEYIRSPNNPCKKQVNSTFLWVILSMVFLLLSFLLSARYIVLAYPNTHREYYR